MTPRLVAAVQAVEAAARVTRFVGARLRAADQRTKSDASPVTVADLAAQAVISLRLGTSTPLVGEEDASFLRSEAGASLRQAVVLAVRHVLPKASEASILDAIDAGHHDGGSGRWWTLDPIDGTKGFLRGMQYAVALAHVEEGAVTDAVMACPHLGTPSAAAEQVFDFNPPRPPGRLFAARAGQGTWALSQPVPARPGSRATRLHARPWQPPAVRVAVSYERAHGRAEALPPKLQAAQLQHVPVRLDSQAKYALLAAGSVDAYVRIPRKASYRENIWDHAAGALLAQEAGVRVTDLDGKALDWTRGRKLIKNRGILAAQEALHPRLVKMFREPPARG